MGSASGEVPYNDKTHIDFPLLLTSLAYAFLANAINARLPCENENLK